MASFAVEVDHVFVSASVGAPEAQHLIDLGLVEGSSNRHPGQGTANRRFFFANAMLELIWIEDEREARSEAEPARRLHLWERWSGRDGAACPFGVCLRPAAGQSDVAPFPAWEYRPAYWPVGTVRACIADSRAHFVADVRAQRSGALRGDAGRAR